MTVEYHLVQVNTAKMKADLEDPIMSGFVERLDEINTLADNSKGFVWRFQTDEGDATYLRPYEDKRILFNMSVWETIDDLKNYVYSSKHLELLKSKNSWFSKLGEAHLALWWIEKGKVPTVQEALDKLNLIQKKGPSPDVFNFSKPFPK
jgi:heme-degrading monooxygenase HmoA